MKLYGIERVPLIELYLEIFDEACVGVQLFGLTRILLRADGTQLVSFVVADGEVS